MLSRGGGIVWNAKYCRVDSSRVFLVEYSTSGQQFWFLDEYGMVWKNVLLPSACFLQCALEGRSISGCTRTAGAMLLDMGGFSI